MVPDEQRLAARRPHSVNRRLRPGHRPAVETWPPVGESHLGSGSSFRRKGLPENVSAGFETAPEKTGPTQAERIWVRWPNKPARRRSGSQAERVGRRFQRSLPSALRSIRRSSASRRARNRENQQSRKPESSLFNRFCTPAFRRGDGRGRCSTDCQGASAATRPTSGPPLLGLHSVRRTIERYPHTCSRTDRQGNGSAPAAALRCERARAHRPSGMADASHLPVRVWRIPIVWTPRSGKAASAATWSWAE